MKKVAVGFDAKVTDSREGINAIRYPLDRAISRHKQMLLETHMESNETDPWSWILFQLETMQKSLILTEEILTKEEQRIAEQKIKAEVDQVLP